MSNTQIDTPQIDPAVWRTVWTVLGGGLAVLFDTTIVAVALRTLADDLHTSIATIQWVTTGYLVALAITIPITGWAQRVLGSKRLWIIALALFLCGSVLSSLAWNAGSLIAFRTVQGVGGGVMLPLMSTLVVQAAGGNNLGRIMSVVSLPAVLGPILGPVVGGFILQHLHWSWMFWVNVPFCVAGIVLAVVVLPEDGPVRRTPLDVVGFLLMAPGLVGILWGISNSSKTGGFGRADVVAPLVAGLVLMAGFVARALRRRGSALVDVRLLKHWPLASSSLLLFLSGVTLYGAMILLPLYFQQLRVTTVLMAGVLLIPQGLGTLASRALAGKLADTMGARLLVLAGFLIVLLGTLPFGFAEGHAAVRLRRRAHQRVVADGRALRARNRPRRRDDSADGPRVSGTGAFRGARREHHHPNRRPGGWLVRRGRARGDSGRRRPRGVLDRFARQCISAVVLVGNRVRRRRRADLARAARATPPMPRGLRRRYPSLLALAPTEPLGGRPFARLALRLGQWHRAVV
ncbi:MAG: DHA2 family efflux MFS transporter permease subunit [Humibacillus sp.]|nr:DHA2 family efflux MFS transporter permease subunit [Humibacillus sp.]MDN5777602.1 DHA2 family efflux MFS transporter permease subunit [Humibacillus sp.]